MTVGRVYLPFGMVTQLGARSNFRDVMVFFILWIIIRISTCWTTSFWIPDWLFHMQGQRRFEWKLPCFYFFTIYFTYILTPKNMGPMMTFPPNGYVEPKVSFQVCWPVKSMEWFGLASEGLWKQIVWKCHLIGELVGGVYTPMHHIINRYH